MLKTTKIEECCLESGVVLHDVPVAYRTWGRMNEAGTNVIVVCHTLTANTDVAAWWGLLLGPGQVLDTDRYFIICMNVPGSPYGSVSPLTPNPATGVPYGADFPLFTIRDTVALHKAVLDQFGVKQIALAIGGSMGAMQVLEWAFYGAYVQALVPVASGGRHSAWCIGWTEAQRQAIFADPRWQDGRYSPDDPPVAGLATARMLAMLSYQSREAFEQRFRYEQAGTPIPEGVESYLLYQGDKLVRRFDANCYVTLTRQLNTHDVSTGRGDYLEVLRQIVQPALIIGVDSDVLYPLCEQEELAEHLPNAELAVVHSPHGHDAFLIEQEQLRDCLEPWVKQYLNQAPLPAEA